MGAVPRRPGQRGQRGQDALEPPPGTLLGRGRTADVLTWGEWGDRRVLKRFRDGTDPATVEGEADALALAATTGLPAPRLVERVTAEGHPGLVLERVDGPTMLDELSERPWRLRRVAGELAELQTRLQQAPGTGLPPLRARLADRIAVAPLDAPVRERALAALARLPDGDRLCHGDLHPGNVVVTATGPSVVDWADATCGHPDGDAARTWLLLQVAPVPPGAKLQPILETLRDRFCRAWLAAYRRARPEADLDTRLAAWLGVVAAARLGEGIEAETPALRRLVEAAFGA